MLIDDVTIRVSGGHGGRGAVAFQRVKLARGPTGGSGGTGGSVYAEGVADVGALRQFRFEKEVLAERGEDGKRQFNDGHRGRDVILRLPVGTVIHNLTTGFDQEVVKIGERPLLARGGAGGKGNFLFRSSTNTSPREFQPGLSGERYELRLELKLIADVGLTGLPNAGKSSLLNALTRAQSKVANYQFTTLEPHLGAYGELILADIPGLIEGAATGKGLGFKFLRHIERTKTLFHLISAEAEQPLQDHQIIRAELEKYNPALLAKPEQVLLTKTDLLAPPALKEKLRSLAKLRPLALSIYDLDSLQTVKRLLDRLTRDKIKTG